jgi:hypothetical protein
MSGAEALVESTSGSDAALVELARICKQTGEIPVDNFIALLTAILPALDDIVNNMHQSTIDSPLPDWIPHALTDSLVPILRVLATQLPPDEHALKLVQHIFQCTPIYLSVPLTYCLLDSLLISRLALSQPSPLDLFCTTTFLCIAFGVNPADLADEVNPEQKNAKTINQRKVAVNPKFFFENLGIPVKNHKKEGDAKDAQTDEKEREKRREYIWEEEETLAKLEVQDSDASINAIVDLFKTSEGRDKCFVLAARKKLFSGKSENSQKHSWYLVNFINLFGWIGGFDAIVARMSETKKCSPLDQALINRYLRAVLEVSEILNTDFLEQVVPSLQQAVFSFYLDADDDLVRLISKNSANSILFKIEKLLTLMKNAEYATMTVEQFLLEFCWKLYHTPYLEKRISGLNDIRDTIITIQKKEEYLKKQKTALGILSNVVGGLEPTPAYVSLWMTTDYLAEWVLKKDLLTEIFTDPKTHVELIRRTPVMLKLLVEKKQLNAAHLDTLWSVASGEHEYKQHLAYDIIAEISAFVSLPLMNHLFESIQQRPPEEYDSQMLKMVKTFTLNAFKANAVAQAATKSSGKGNERSQVGPWYGLDIFWKISQLQHSDSIAKHIPQEALEFFFQVLGTDYALPRRDFYAQVCVDNLKNRNQVFEHLTVLQKILKTYPTGSKSWLSSMTGANQVFLSDILGDLETRTQLLDAVVVEMISFKQEILKLVGAEGRLNEGKIRNSGLNDVKISPTSKGFLAQIRIRLDFLVFVLAYSSFGLQKEQLDVIWENIIANPVTVEEQDAWWVWMLHMRPNFDDADVLYLLNTKISSLSVANLTPLGFKAFKEYSVHVLENSNAITIVRSYDREKDAVDVNRDTDPGKIIVSNMKACANVVNIFWKVALESSHKQVARKAIRLLNCLHSNLNISQKGKNDGTSAPEIRENFVKRCLTTLEEGIKSNTVSIISRSLQILYTFLESFVKRSSKGLTLNFICEKEIRADPFSVTIPYSATILELRKKVFHILHDLNPGISEKHLVIHWPKEKKSITSTSVTLSKLGFSQNEELWLRYVVPGFGRIVNENTEQPAPELYPYPIGFLASKLKEIHEDLEDKGTTFLDPSLEKIASNPKTFDSLFNLLNSKSGISEHVWEILNILPKSKEHVAKLQNLANINWNVLLEPESPFKLLYNLQIIEELFPTTVDIGDMKSDALPRKSKKGNGPPKQDTSIKWGCKFARAGGFDFLLSLVIDEKFITIPPEVECPRAVFDNMRALLLNLLSKTLSLDPEFKKASPIEEKSDCAESGLVTKLVEKQSEVLGRLQQIILQDSNTVQHDFIVEAVNLLCALLLNSSMSENSFFSSDSLERFFSRILLQLDDENGRWMVASSVVSIVHLRPAVILKHLLAILNSSSFESYARYSEQYFLVLVETIECVKEHDVLADLGQHTQKQLTSLRCVETYQSQFVDQRLLGLIRLIHVLVRKKAIDIADLSAFIYQRLLFDIPGEHSLGCLCKTIKSRSAAYALLFELFQHSVSSRSQILKLIESDTIWERQSSVWQYSPHQWDKPAHNFVGLKNQGATCYMNSLMQQVIVFFLDLTDVFVAFYDQRFQTWAVPYSRRCAEPACPQKSSNHVQPLTSQ